MRRNKKILIGLIILVILIAIIILISFNNNKEEVSKLNNILEKLTTSSDYIFTEEKNEAEKTIMAKKGDKTLIDQYFNGVHRTTIVENDSTCFILHDREEYYIYNNNNIEQKILEDGIKELLEKEYITGDEKIFGKKYAYEEYSGSSVFLLNSIRDVEEENIKTRLYFDKNDDLKYIKTIFGEDEELLNIDIKYEVDDSIFEIPSNYAEGN